MNEVLRCIYRICTEIVVKIMQNALMSEIYRENLNKIFI